MVTTRSQSIRQGRKDGRSPSRFSVNSGSSSSSGSGSKGGSPAKGNRATLAATQSPSRRSSRLEQLQREASRASGSGSAIAAGAENGGGELLGRGHRVSRETRTLDEEYLALSYHHGQRAHDPSDTGKGRHGQRRQADAEQEALVIHARYPPRAAAQRALSNLQHTLHAQDHEEEDAASSSASGSSLSSEETDDDASSAPSTNQYNFRHHPEIGECMAKGLPVSSSASSSSDSTDSRAPSSSRADRGEGEQGRRAGAHTGKHSTGRGSGGSGEGDKDHAKGANLGGARNGSRVPITTTTSRANQKRGRDSSIDSSISNESMREASVEEMMRQDVKEHRRLTGRHSASDTDSAEEEHNGVVTEKEMRRAMRNAKESTARNVNINHYMQDAVGKEDARTERRRRIDRRYRHLLMLDEEAKDRQGGGGGGGGGGGTGAGGSGAAGDAGVANGALGDISPLKVDASITFDSVGGLPGHIVALREMVLLPLLYPQLLKSMNLSPPRGVLFVGPPGTGKTLMARALAVEGSRCSEKKVTFFMRKGADILSKWVGESERQLKLLFEEARRLQPSIICFDEIDGLAPTRHTKTEQTQAALVATLLALLDGLDDRGQVIVIGATNRPDTIDPALRRPGRFDRELTFPLPDAAARRHILTILTEKQSLTDTTDKSEVVEELVRHTEGYSGADLKALCTEAGLNRLRTALPQLYTTSKRLVLPNGLSASPAQLAIRKEDFFAAARRINPSLQRGGQEMHLTHMDEHLEKLFRSARGALLSAVSQVYITVARALAKERRDCSDLGSAVRRLSSFPIPYARHALVLFLHVSSSSSSSSGGGGGVAQGRGEDGGVANVASEGHRSVPRSPAQACRAGPSAAKKQRSKSHSASSSRPSHGEPLPPPEIVPSTHTSTLEHGEAAADARTACDKAVQLTAATQMVLMGAAVAVMRGLPTFQTFMVHLPHVRVAFAAAAGGVGEEGVGSIRGPAAVGSPFAGAGFTGGHMYELVLAVQRASPCVVLLRGAEEWLQDQGLPLPEEEGTGDGATAKTRNAFSLCEEELEERASRMAAMRYYLNLLADTEAILLIPCVSDRTRQALLGTAATSPPLEEASHKSTLVSCADGVETRLVPSSQHALHPHFTVLTACVQPVPTLEDRQRFVSHLYCTIALAFRVQSVMAARAPTTATTAFSSGGGERTSCAQPPPLAVDDRPRQPEPLSREQRRAQHRQALELWRRVEYRRLQLRHVLLKWVSQFINSGRFKLLLSPDLDLHPESPTFKEWRQHTKHTRIGLDNILERLETEQYVCLSQFHDDVDVLVRNVRSFFRSRAQFDQRYRMKALELKETTVLNMYKINRSVVRFCEAHRDVSEPPALSSEDDENEGAYGPTQQDTDETAIALENDVDHSSQALRFRQRPAVPARPRKKFRIFGQRRRRHRRAPPAKKKTPAAVAEDEDENEDNDEGDDVHEADEVDGGEESHPRQASGGRAVGSEHRLDPICSPSSRSKSSRSVDANEAAPGGPLSLPSPLSPVYPPDAKIEAWAAALLCGLTYHKLHRVFQRVMQALDAEVRRRDAGFTTPDPQRAAQGMTKEAHAADGDSPQPKPVAPRQSLAARSSTSRDGKKGPSASAPAGAAATEAGAGEEEEEEEERPEAFFARCLSAAVAVVRREGS